MILIRKESESPDTFIANIDEGVVILEPKHEFNDGIIGYNQETKQLIYGEDETLLALSVHYGEEDAVEWLHYYTYRAIPYMGDTKPVFVESRQDMTYV